MSYLKTKPSEILKVNQNNVDTGFSVLEYFFVLALIIYGGSANTFVRTFSLDKPLPFLFILSFSLIIAIRSGVVFSRKIYLLLLGYTIYFVILTIKFSELHPRFFAYLFIQFIITYIAVKAFKLNFFRIYEVLVYYLAIIGLLFSLIAGIMIYIGYFELLKTGLDYNSKKNTIIYSLMGMVLIIIVEIILKM